ncbi:MAG: FAD-dependent oxidoreductase [Candidatus Woesearchaeota archaeon]|nr:FAD-dependent oxidoreductase [Candidatus Woesearchaeota archaeon]
MAKIVVIGGGFGGLESAFYLRMRLKKDAEITLVSDKPYFLFKPNLIYVPFGSNPEDLKIDLEKACRKKNISFVKSKVTEIDTKKKIVKGEVELGYDYLIISTGAGMSESDIPGLKEFSHKVWTPIEMLELRNSFFEIISEEKKKKVVFLVPPKNRCSGPLYEMAMMLDSWLWKKKSRRYAEIIYTTYESGYIQAFGPRLNKVVEDEFEERHIKGHKGYYVKSIDEKKIYYENGEEIEYDILITFPPYEAAVHFKGLPCDAQGFIDCDFETRQVKKHPEIYVVGDAGNFPIKQAYLALLEANAAAEHLSSKILKKEPRFVFSATSMCVMEQFDKATFAQVPLKVVDSHPEVDESKIASYRVGTSKIWRLGKWMLGVYLPFRYRNGNPFHAGLPWKLMDIGLKIMSRIMAN